MVVDHEVPVLSVHASVANQKKRRGGYSTRGGETIHALYQNGSRSLCGVQNCSPTENGFDPNSAYACMRCARQVRILERDK